MNPRMKCARCRDTHWVCETHDDRPVERRQGLRCGAGMPCPSCNVSNPDNPPRLPAGFRRDESLDEERATARPGLATTHRCRARHDRSDSYQKLTAHRPLRDHFACGSFGVSLCANSGYQQLTAGLAWRVEDQLAGHNRVLHAQ
jgi:hypothetical protein